MVDSILAHAEYLALGVNVLLTAAFIVRGDWAHATYWFGTIILVIGVIMIGRSS